MANVCKCGLEFGAPATLRIHENKCTFASEKVIDLPKKKRKAK